MSKVIWDCIGFALLHSVIGLENLRHTLNQSDASLKPIATWLLTFSHASGQLHVFTLSSQWLRVILTFVLIHRRDYLCFGSQHSTEKRSNSIKYCFDLPVILVYIDKAGYVMDQPFAVNSYVVYGKKIAMLKHKICSGTSITNTCLVWIFQCIQVYLLHQHGTFLTFCLGKLEQLTSPSVGCPSTYLVLQHHRVCTM